MRVGPCQQYNLIETADKICLTRCKRICRTADALKKERHIEVATARIVMALELKISISLSTDLATNTKINRNPIKHVLHYSLCFTTTFYVLRDLIGICQKSPPKNLSKYLMIGLSDRTLRRKKIPSS